MEELVACSECGDKYPPEELKREKTLGLLCSYCICSLKLNGKKLEFMEIKDEEDRRQNI